jgi:hypothetical protein
LIIRADISLDVGRKRRLLDPATDLRPAPGQRIYILGVERLDALCDATIEAILAQKGLVRLRGGGKAAGDAHAGLGQSADHFAE